MCCFNEVHERNMMIEKTMYTFAPRVETSKQRESDKINILATE